MSYFSKKFPDWLVTTLEIDKAKQTPLEGFFEGKLVPNGNTIRALCPFHQEKSPSFVIYKSTNTYYCFGCQRTGDVIQFIKEKTGKTFIDAVKFLIGE